MKYHEMKSGSSSAMKKSSSSSEMKKSGSGSSRRTCAPCNIPVRRRLQTFSLLSCLYLMPLCMLLNWALLFYRPFTALYTRELWICYVLWLLVFDRNTPKKGGRPIAWFQNLPIWRWGRDYFPADLHAPSGALKAGKKLLCSHPHGIISMGVIFNFALNQATALEVLGLTHTRGIRVATVSFNFLVPLWRELVLAAGFVDASYQSLEYCLDHDITPLIVIGGAQETLSANPGSADLVLNKRMGFAKLAVETGAALVGVYTFGENELYQQLMSPVLSHLQKLAIRLLGFTFPVFRGRGIFNYSFGLLPRRVPLHSVVGEPIPVAKGDKKDTALVQAVHDSYVQALKRLHDSCKDKYWHPTDFWGNPIPAEPLRIVA